MSRVSASRPPHASDSSSVTPLHADPPMTPAGFLLPRPRLIWSLGVLFVAVGVAAAVNHGSLLLTWDEPIQRWVEGARNDSLHAFFGPASRLGSTYVVLALGPIAAIVTRRRCRAVATALVVATLSRPMLEFVIKILVDRDRPNLDRLASGDGPSFPSGHVMAAVALWGLLPMVVSLYTRRRGVWWASVIVSAGMILSISASRLYLGVHWFSDVVGGLVLGCFFLLGVEAVLNRQHRRRSCLAGEAQEPVLPAPAASEDERVLVDA